MLIRQHLLISEKNMVALNTWSSNRSSWWSDRKHKFL